MQLKRVLFFLIAIASTIVVVLWADLSLTASTPSAQFLIEDRSTYTPNSLLFKRVEYVGQCPGTAFEPTTIKARFTSTLTPPAHGRRVVIRNVTEGMNTNPTPYTNREYENGRYSESFYFKLDFEHHDQSFSVLAGENKFEYTIQDNQTIIEEGALSTQVTIRDINGTFQRNIVCQEEKQCETKTDYDSWDDNHKHGRTYQDCHPVKKCACP